MNKKTPLQMLEEVPDFRSGNASHDVFRSVFGKLDPEALKKGFGVWTEAPRDEIKGRAISIDAKSIRGGKHGEIKAKHIVRAFTMGAVEEQIRS